MEAYQKSVEAGFSPVEFWGLTPYLTFKALPALRDRQTITAWQAAALNRTKTMPKLETLVCKVQEKPDLEQKLTALFKGHNAARKYNGRT